MSNTVYSLESQYYEAYKNQRILFFLTTTQFLVTHTTGSYFKQFQSFNYFIYLCISK